MNLGNNIKLIRTRWGLKQGPFGELLGVSSGQIAKYEGNENDPRLPTLLTLIELSGISFYDLYTKEIDITEIPSKPLEDYKSRKVMLTTTSNDQSQDEVKKLQGELIDCMKENRELRLVIDELKKK